MAVSFLTAKDAKGAVRLYSVFSIFWLRQSILLNQPATVSALRHRLIRIPEFTVPGDMNGGCVFFNRQGRQGFAKGAVRLYWVFSIFWLRKSILLNQPATVSALRQRLFRIPEFTVAGNMNDGCVFFNRQGRQGFAKGAVKMYSVFSIFWLRQSILLNQPATVSALRHGLIRISDLLCHSAEGATYKSHGCEPMD
jgi:uncharacterized protein (DUF486 family)